MLRIITIIFFVFVSSVVLSQNTDSLKCWCKDDKLKWSDFRGRKSEKDDSINLNAMSSIGVNPIPLRKNGLLLGYQVKVVFRRYSSWKTDTADYLLIHEQLHFDIAELTARKLRKAMQEIKAGRSNLTAQDFRVIIQELYLEDANMQSQYDDETIHGIIAESQIEWEKKISFELKKLEDYASTSLDCQLH